MYFGHYVLCTGCRFVFPDWTSGFRSWPLCLHWGAVHQKEKKEEKESTVTGLFECKSPRNDRNGRHVPRLMQIGYTELVHLGSRSSLFRVGCNSLGGCLIWNVFAFSFLCSEVILRCMMIEYLRSDRSCLQHFTFFLCIIACLTQRLISLMNYLHSHQVMKKTTISWLELQLSDNHARPVKRSLTFRFWTIEQLK